MQITFVGSGIKKDAEDFIYRICERVQNNINQIFPKDINIKYQYKSLSQIFGIDNEEFEEDEVLVVEGSLNFENLSINFELKKLVYEEENINVFVEINYKNETRAELTKDQKYFIYALKVEISKAVSKYTKSINWLYDEQNADMLQELYSEIYNLENTFRGIINEYMLKMFGENWFEQKIVQEFNQKSEDFGEWYNSKYVKLRYISSEIFNLQTRDLIGMLKLSYDNEYVNKVSKYINEIKTNLKQDVDKIIKENVLESKTLWEKYFEDKFPMNIEEQWDEFSKMRNTVAHNKVISREFYDDLMDKSSKLKKVLEVSRVKIKESIKSQEEVLLKEYIESLNLEFILSDIDFKEYDEDEVIEAVVENDEFANLCSLVEELAEKLKNKYIDIWGDLDMLESKYSKEMDIETSRKYLLNINRYFNNNNPKIIEEVIDKTDKIEILNEVRDSLEEIISMKKNKFDESIESIEFNNQFLDKQVIFSANLESGREILIKVNGWFCVGRGEMSNIDIVYKVNNKLIEKGYIEISMGDYEEHDDGYYLPTQEQKISVNTDKLQEVLLQDINNEIYLLAELEKNLDSILGGE